MAVCHVLSVGHKHDWHHLGRSARGHLMVIPFEREPMTIRARERGAVGWPTTRAQGLTRHAGGIGMG
jgi:hypothetical protein